MKKLYAVLISIIIFNFLNARDYTGVNTAAFLRLVPDAKTAGMGRTFTAVADNEAAVFFNPAGIAFQNYNSFAFTHHIMFEDIKKEFLTVKFKPHNVPIMMAVSGLYIDYGSLKRTTYSAPEGLGNFSANEGYIMLSLGKMIEERLALGGNLKLLRRKIDTFDDEGFAGDISMLYKFLEYNFQIGAGYYNIGPDISLYDKNEHLPGMFRAGIAWLLLNNQITLAFDIFKVRDEKFQYGLGFNWGINNTIFLRAGYNSENDIGSGFSFGGGIKLQELTLDYAYEQNDDVKDAHYITVAFRFGKTDMNKVNKKEAEKQKIESVQQQYEQEEPQKEILPAASTAAQQQESEITKAFKLHTYFANQFYFQGNYEDALLEIKLANQLMWEQENIKLELKLLIKLKFFNEAEELVENFINFYPALKNEMNY